MLRRDKKKLQGPSSKVEKKGKGSRGGGRGGRRQNRRLSPRRLGRVRLGQTKNSSRSNRVRLRRSAKSHPPSSDYGATTGSDQSKWFCRPIRVHTINDECKMSSQEL